MNCATNIDLFPSVSADNTVDPQSVNEVFNYIKDMASWAPFRAQIDIMLHREFEEISSQENDLKV